MVLYSFVTVHDQVVHHGHILASVLMVEVGVFVVARMVVTGCSLRPVEEVLMQEVAVAVVVTGCVVAGKKVGFVESLNDRKHLCPYSQLTAALEAASTDYWIC